MFILPYIGIDKLFDKIEELSPDASSFLPGRCYPTSESVSQPPSDPKTKSGQSEWSETEPEGESEEADEHDEERSLSIDLDNDTHLLL